VCAGPLRRNKNYLGSLVPPGTKPAERKKKKNRKYISCLWQAAGASSKKEKKRLGYIAVSAERGQLKLS